MSFEDSDFMKIERIAKKRAKFMDKEEVIKGDTPGGGRSSIRLNVSQSGGSIKGGVSPFLRHANAFPIAEIALKRSFSAKTCQNSPERIKNKGGLESKS